jgi:hypothetical protein
MPWLLSNGGNGEQVLSSGSAHEKPIIPMTASQKASMPESQRISPFVQLTKAFNY